MSEGPKFVKFGSLLNVTAGLRCKLTAGRRIGEEHFILPSQLGASRRGAFYIIYNTQYLPPLEDSASVPEHVCRNLTPGTDQPWG